MYFVCSLVIEPLYLLSYNSSFYSNYINGFLFKIIMFLPCDHEL